MAELKRWKAFVKDGHIRLMSPSGEIVTDEIEGAIINDVEGPNVYRSTFLVDVYENEEQAKASIK